MRKEDPGPVRRVSVITDDVDLVKRCKEALRLRNGHLTIRHDTSADPGADLWVWDCRSSEGVPHNLPSCDLPKSMFLVNRDRLVEFPEDILMFAATVALLPIDVARLSIALEQAFARQEILGRMHRGKDPAGRKDALLQCLLQANLRLQECDQDRTNFLNRTLHDFRAPLTSITGYCGILRSGAAGKLEPSQSELIQRIENSARRLGRLADGLFQLGVRRFKQIKPELVKGDIQATMETALAEVEPLASQKQLTISVQMDEPESDVLFEPAQIVQVLVNILENACRFSPRRRTIEIKGYSYFWERRSRHSVARTLQYERRSRHQRTANCYRIDISDAGPGILPEQLGSIFEEYTSYSGGKDRSGTGLGLAISKGIIDLHNGRIWAESSTGGAIFSFVLPYASAALEPERALAAGG
jgi:signal transduction histidine kinase